MNGEKILEVRHLSKKFGENTVLIDIDFSVHTGSVICIIGASGSGKSTLLRCINLLETPTSGEVLFHGTDITKPGTNIPAYRAKVGMVFQNFNLFNNMTALKNCMIGTRRVLGLSSEESHERALFYLNKVGMSPFINAKPRQLSGGQKQRVAIARSLAMGPIVMLFDEPTSALDPELIGEVLTVMKDLAVGGMTMICVTHEIGFARDVCSRIVFMEHGEIVEQGNPEKMLNHPDLPRTKQFLGKISELH